MRPQTLPWPGGHRQPQPHRQTATPGSWWQKAPPATAGTHWQRAVAPCADAETGGDAGNHAAAAQRSLHHHSFPKATTPLLPSSLHIVFHKLLSIFLQHLIDLVDQGVHFVPQLFALGRQIRCRRARRLRLRVTGAPHLLLTTTFCAGDDSGPLRPRRSCLFHNHRCTPSVWAIPLPGTAYVTMLATRSAAVSERSSNCCT